MHEFVPHSAWIDCVALQSSRPFTKKPRSFAPDAALTSKLSQVPERKHPYVRGSLWKEWRLWKHLLPMVGRESAVEATTSSRCLASVSNEQEGGALQPRCGRRAVQGATTTLSAGGNRGHLIGIAHEDKGAVWLGVGPEHSGLRWPR